jgi:hypothetical protein
MPTPLVLPVSLKLMIASLLIVLPDEVSLRPIALVPGTRLPSMTIDGAKKPLPVIVVSLVLIVGSAAVGEIVQVPVTLLKP